ncbi:MAG TPA: hypothetical protein VD884_16265 [Ohtaekwangia sp.]|nr:hypothetical protein [Ohtaekwangia sp.]
MLCANICRSAVLLLCFTIHATFSFSQNESPEAAYSVVTPFESYIHAKCKEVFENGNTTDRFTENELADLPIGLSSKATNGNLFIVIDSARRDESGGWFFSAYASIVLPGTSRPIAFAAKNIGFNKGGLTSSSAIQLHLVTSRSIDVSESLTIRLDGNGGNYIAFDCDGFKSINLKGNFEFSKEMFVPDDDVLVQDNVRASFEINTADLNNILTTVSFTPFRINGLDELSFQVTNAVADFSDLANPPGFIFPQEYQHSYGETITLWRGFYLNEVIIRIKGLSDDGTDAPSIQAKNLLIDDLGISGTFTASNLLTLQQGSADGWPLSVDQLSVKLLFNKVNGGMLGGFLTIPFLGDDPVAYTAAVEQSGKDMNYRFSIATPGDKEFNTPFGATIRIDKGSIITLESRQGKLIPSTRLHGNLSFKKGELDVEALRFENLGLTSRKPFITSGVFSTAGSGQAKSVGFPVRIDSVNLRVYQGEAALGFAIALNFMNKEDKGFTASTFVQALAKVEESKETIPSGEETVTRTSQKWKFEKITVNDIKLDCRTAAFTLAGTLQVFNDNPTYGNGFHGKLNFSIKKILQKGVKVNAYFGSKDTFRYWHVDAFVPTGNMQIVPPLAINGFMGGASYKMVRQQPLLPDFSKLGGSATLATGNSEYDFKYIPDEKSALAFMAGVTLVVGNERAVNADAMLEVAFNDGGGIKYAQFNGAAFFFTSIDGRGRIKEGKIPKAPVYASLNMLYDNDNDVFHANMETYINLAGIIEGTKSDGLVGEAVIHVNRRDWYMYIGRPSQMFGLKILKLATAQTYFMVGTKIENLPPPPPEVRKIFGSIDRGLMRDDLAAAGGKGFATGAHFKLKFDSKKKLRPFYIVIAVGAGTDIMLRNYGNAQCAGRDGKVGIGGWYASGQAYVFLKGKVGVRVRGRNFDIVSLGLAARLQAKLPNPTWLKGKVTGRYSVLGGLVSGRFNLKFTVGDECELINPGGEIDDIVVIADIKPDNLGTDVSVFSAPQVSFNTAIETEFKMMDLQDNMNGYRVKLDELSLSQNGQVINGTITWNSNKDVAIIKTQEILQPETELKVFVKIHWEKKSGGSWEIMKDDDGKVIYEAKESIFKTGTAPDFIPEENVAFSYPVKQQHNFHVNESGDGFVKLNFGQAYLFPETEGDKQWKYFARFRDNRGKISEVPIQYKVASSTIHFTFPSLEKQSIYSMTFIKKPASADAIDQNLVRNQTQADGGEGNEVNIQSNTLEGTIVQNVEKDLYKSAFRSSQFGTFAEKWVSFSEGADAFDVAKGNVAVIGKRLSTQEAFDEFELTGREGGDPFVQVSASPHTPWMTDVIAPLLYNAYSPNSGLTIEWRDPQVLGIKPLKGVKLANDLASYKLTDNEINSGVGLKKAGSVLVGYYLSYYAYWDYDELTNKAAAKYYDNWSSRPEAAKRLLASTGYTDLIGGNYPVNIQYIIPGTEKPTYSNQMIIHF